MDASFLSPAVAFSLLLVFSIIWIGLGWYLGKSNRTLDDYMLAGRKVGFALATATAMATWVTSNTTMAAPQLAYQLGVWGMVGYSLGAIGLMLFAPIATRIKTILPHGYTSGDFIRLRYGVGAWRTFLIISLVYALGWLISLGMAGGVVVNALSGLDYEIGMTVILAVCVGYTMLGGLRAVIATDFIQSIIIILGLLLLAWIVIQQVGFQEIHVTLSDERPALLNLLFPAAIMFLFNNLLFGVGEIFHSNVWWSRAFAFKEGVGGKAYFIAGLMWLPIPIVAGFVALAAPSLDLSVASADMVGPLVAGKLLGTAGAVIVFIVVFSALASSLDSLLAATSDLITEDIYRGHINPTADNQQIQRVNKFIVLALGFFAWLLCLPKISTLASLLYFMGAFVASAIWPIVLGIYYGRANGTTASLAMLFGTSVGLWAYFAIGFYVAALVSCAISLAVMLLGSIVKNAEFTFDTVTNKER
ncbi:MAG: hypothetical protein MI867_17590 [Pseudomonadales bacterium]|nr:hypothetical protein [Pseudomonadales bacterium]